MNEILAKYSSFVKEQHDYHQRSATKYQNRGDSVREKQYSYRAQMFQELLQDLSSLSDSLISHNSTNPLNLTPDDIHDLPEELLQELNVSDSDRRDFLIIDLIDQNGGISTIDKLLIGIYRQTGEIEKRPKITARLYRMAKKELIFPHPTRKGVYSTKLITQDDEQTSMEEKS